jgi:hypothetical protein
MNSAESFHFWYSILYRNRNTWINYLNTIYHHDYNNYLYLTKILIYPKINNGTIHVEVYHNLLFEMIYPPDGLTNYHQARHKAWFKRISDLRVLYNNDKIKCFKNKFWTAIQSVFHRKSNPWIPKPNSTLRGGTFFFGTAFGDIPISKFKYDVIPNVCFLEISKSLQEKEHIHFLIGLTYPRNRRMLELILKQILGVPTSVEPVRYSYLICKAYLKIQEIEDSVLMIANGYNSFLNYHSYFNDLLGMKSGEYISKTCQHDLPYNHIIDMSTYLRCGTHPPRWISRYAIHLKYSKVSLDDILDNLISSLFNSRLDVHYIQSCDRDGNFDLSTYQIQPIVCVFQRKSTRFDWGKIPEGDIPPFVVVLYEGEYNIRSVSQYHKDVESLNQISLKSMLLEI